MTRIRLGVALLIVSEAGFFLMLIAAYAFYATIPSSGPSAAKSLDVARTAAFSVLLFSSSATIHLASRAMRDRAAARVIGWLATTIALGTAFIIGQAIEYRGLYRAG